MTRLFKKIAYSHPSYLDGSNSTEKVSENIRLCVVEYSESQCVEYNDVTLEECLRYLGSPSMTWVQVFGVSDKATVAAIGKAFQLHPLVIEDIMSLRQRSKLDLYDDQVFVVARLLQSVAEGPSLRDEQVSLIFGPNYLVSFLEGQNDILSPVKERILHTGGRIRKLGSDYLAYAILDAIVDHYFSILEKVDADLDTLEEELIHLPQAETIERIQLAKRDMIILRKAVWPLRDVVSRFMHLDDPFVAQQTRVYLRDVYDHIVQMIDIVEGFRDIVGSMFDIYLSNINIRTNEIVKVLTIVSTIFVPLTFITSLYGMNFENMPELHTRFGYPILICVMLATALGMLSFFRHKKWI